MAGVVADGAGRRWMAREEHGTRWKAATWRRGTRRKQRPLRITGIAPITPSTTLSLDRALSTCRHHRHLLPSSLFQALQQSDQQPLLISATAPEAQVKQVAALLPATCRRHCCRRSAPRRLSPSLLLPPCSSMEVSVSFGKQTAVVALPSLSATCADLAAELEHRFGQPPLALHTIKLLVPKKGVLHLAEHGDEPLAAAGAMWCEG